MNSAIHGEMIMHFFHVVHIHDRKSCKLNEFAFLISGMKYFQYSQQILKDFSVSERFFVFLLHDMQKCLITSQWPTIKRGHSSVFVREINIIN